MKTWIAAGPRFRTRSSLASNKRHFRPNLDERCRAFDDGEYLVAGRAPEYVQFGQDAEAGDGPGRVHDAAAMRARTLFGWVIHPARTPIRLRPAVCHRTPLQKGKWAGVDYPLCLPLIATCWAPSVEEPLGL